MSYEGNRQRDPPCAESGFGESHAVPPAVFDLEFRVKRSGGTVRTVQFVHTPNKRHRLFGVF